MSELAIPSMVTLHQFKYYDWQSRLWRKAGDYATAKTIQAIGGEIIPGTAIAVEASRVGHTGLLDAIALTATA